jgi:preprotein translocase subunit SecG
MLYQIVIVFHILLGVGIVGLVLMQHGKGADAGATFGGGASGSVFGAQGSASFLSRTTAIFASLFFTTSLVLAILSGNQGKKADIMDSAPATVAPANDVPAPAADVPTTALPTAPAEQTVNPK